MAKREWQIEVDGETHRVRIRHSMWVDDCRVWVDDLPTAIEPRFRFALADYANDYVFTVGGRDAVLSVRQGGSGYRYRLTVDGIDPDTGEPRGADAWTVMRTMNPVGSQHPRFWAVFHLLLVLGFLAGGIALFSHSTRHGLLPEEASLTNLHEMPAGTWVEVTDLDCDQVMIDTLLEPPLRDGTRLLFEGGCGSSGMYLPIPEDRATRMRSIFELPPETKLMTLTTVPSPANDRVGAWALLGFGLVIGLLLWCVARAHLARRRRGWAIPRSF